MIYQININETVASVFMFSLSLIILIGVTIFFVYWGDRIQLIRRKKWLALISIIPGIITSTIFFLNPREKFGSLESQKQKSQFKLHEFPKR